MCGDHVDRNSLVASDLGITLGQRSFRVVGDLDTAVLVGGAEGNANFTTVSVRATVQTDADSDWTREDLPS